MSYFNTQYKDLESTCINKYGSEKGPSIFNKAEKLFENMLNEADYRNSEVIKYHMVDNILPVLAYYMALLESGFSFETAYEYVLEETQKHALVWKKNNEGLSKLPFAYSFFKLFVKRIMKKNYPIEGWETEWVRRDNNEISFNLKTCVYHETVSKYGHSELCTVFCANDTTSFSGFLPKIKFERSGTIGEGKSMCDFHFINAKKS